MGPRTKSPLITLCILLPGAIAGAQQATKTKQATTVPPALKEMQQVEDRWNDAVTKRDQFGLELVLAPQFIGISATGDVATRNQQIAQLLLKGAGPDSLEQKVVSVRFVGDVAIVNGTYVMSWKTDKGPVLEKGIFSHVFRTRADQLALPQLTAHGRRRNHETGCRRPGKAQIEVQQCPAADAYSAGLQGPKQHPAPAGARHRSASPVGVPGNPCDIVLLLCAHGCFCCLPCRRFPASRHSPPTK